VALDATPTHERDDAEAFLVSFASDLQAAACTGYETTRLAGFGKLAVRPTRTAASSKR
jgi:hypothetical protein